MNFETFLKTRRVQLDLTQTELAQLISVYGHKTSPQRLGHWETGRNQPPMNDRLFREALAKSLRMDMNHMLHELDFTVGESERSTESAMAAGIVNRLSPIAKKVAIDYLELLEKRFSA